MRWNRCHSAVFGAVAGLGFIVAAVWLCVSTSTAEQMMQVKIESKPGDSKDAVTLGEQPYRSARSSMGSSAAPSRARRTAPQPEPQTLRSVRTYRAGMNNVFFDENDFLLQLVAQDEEIAAHLMEMLTIPPIMDDSNDLLEGSSSEARDRMAALDALEGLARLGDKEDGRNDAIASLADLSTRELPDNLGVAAKKVMVGEKYDALVALTRLNPGAAFASFKSISSAARREVLIPALMAGLVDRGVPRILVDAEFQRLLNDAG